MITQSTYEFQMDCSIFILLRDRMQFKPDDHPNAGQNLEHPVLRIVTVVRANRQSTETPGSINPLASSDVAAISACSLSYLVHRAAAGER